MSLGAAPQLGPTLLFTPPPGAYTAEVLTNNDRSDLSKVLWHCGEVLVTRQGSSCLGSVCLPIPNLPNMGISKKGSRPSDRAWELTGVFYSATRRSDPNWASTTRFGDFRPTKN